MIYSFMGGRCGNQMFRYAFARAHQRSNEPIILDYRRVTTHREKGRQDYKNDLADFKLCESVKFLNQETPFEPDLTHTARFCRLYTDHCKRIGNDDEIDKLEKKMEPVFRRLNVYEKLEYFEYPDYSGDRYLLGLAEDSRYFNGIRSVLLEELTPKYPPLPKNERLYDLICSTDSVCLSFRKWNMYHKEFAFTFGICGHSYYRKAIDIMRQLHPNCQFIVFSDDVSWAKENYSFPVGTVFEDDGNPIWEKMRLMYSCRHFVIPNSTFAWWAQYLSRNPDRTVISPDRWSRSGTYQYSAIEPYFLTVCPDETDIADFQ